MSEITSIPITRIDASLERAAEIRSAVMAIRSGPSGPEQRVARPEDAAAFYDFLVDPRVHAAIYSLPRPLTLAATSAFISYYVEAQQRGEGLLLLTWDDQDRVASYSSLEIWPQWAAGELTGALHPDRQSRGAGGSGATRTFGWMFDVLKLDLICATAALDNQRTAKMLDRIGFERKGEIKCVRPDGTERPSRVWEITRDAWFETEFARAARLAARKSVA